MKEVGSLEGVHGSQFSYSLLCKSLKFYVKPWFFLMVIYAIAITTYSYIINMCMFAHSQGAESPVIEAVVLISSHVVHTVRTSRALKSCQFIQHCSNLRACVNSSWLSGPLEWGLVVTEHISSALRLSAASIIWASPFLVRSQSLFCAQLLTLNAEPAKWDLREKPRMWLNTFPWNSLQQKAQETLFFTFLSVILFPFHCYILKLPK